MSEVKQIKLILSVLAIGPFIFLMLFKCLKNTETFKNVSVFLYIFGLKIS